MLKVKQDPRLKYISSPNNIYFDKDSFYQSDRFNFKSENQKNEKDTDHALTINPKPVTRGGFKTHITSPDNRQFENVVKVKEGYDVDRSFYLKDDTRINTLHKKVDNYIIAQELADQDKSRFFSKEELDKFETDLDQTK